MERLLSLLPPRPPSTAVRYAFTAVLVALCVGLVKLVHAETGIYGFFIFYLAIFLASVLFDHGSGFVATALSVAFMYVQLTGGDKSLLYDIAPLLGTFTVISIGVAFVSEGLRMGFERAVAAEQAKDLLLQELRHRTKNDLAMVVSVLSLQARGEKDDGTKAALENAISRIRAIAGAHDHVGPFTNEAEIDIKEYLTKLCDHLAASLRDVRPIKMDVDVEATVMKSRDAIPLGLIVNELVTNALKYAFPDNRPGVVRVTLRNAAPRTLIVEDNGGGLITGGSGGIGTRLTKMLVKQLGGTIDWEDAEPGCRVRVTLAA